MNKEKDKIKNNPNESTTNNSEQDNNYVSRDIYNQKCIELEKKEQELELVTKKFIDLGIKFHKSKNEIDSINSRMERLSNSNKELVFKNICIDIFNIKDGIDSTVECFSNIINNIRSVDPKNKFFSELDGARSGLEIINHLFDTFFMNNKIMKIDTKVSDLFNKEYHYAITFVESEDNVENSIVEIVKCGYKNVENNNILRPAYVIVSKKPIKKLS